MNKRILLLLGLYIYMYSEAGAQTPINTWVTLPHVEFYSKRVQSGTIPDAVVSIDSVDKGTYIVYGAFDSVLPWNSRGNGYLPKITGLNNFIRQRNGVLENPGNAINATVSGVKAYASIQGIEYASMYDDGSALLWKRNPATNNYDSIRNLSADGVATHIFDWGNDHCLIVGNTSDGFTHLNGQEFRGIALWNSQTNALAHIMSSFGDVSSKAIAYKKDTLFSMVTIDSKACVWMLPKGATVWKENVTPVLSCHFPLAIERNGNTYYAIIANGTSFELHQYVEGASGWEKLADLEPRQYTDFKAIRTFTYRNGMLYIAGLIKKCNGQACFEAIAFDAGTKTFKNIGAYFPIGTCSGIFWSDNHLLLSMDESPYNLFWQQITYLVRDTTTKIAFTGPATTTDQKVSLTVSVTGQHDSLTLYQYNPNGPVITYWLKADNTGKVQIPLTLGPGTHTFQATTTNWDGWLSPLSPPFTITVTVPGGGNPEPSPSPGDSSSVPGGSTATVCYPNPARTTVWVPKQYNSLEVYTIDGKQVMQQIFSNPTHDSRIDVSAFASGMYLFVCKTKNQKSKSYKIFVAH